MAFDIKTLKSTRAAGRNPLTTGERVGITGREGEYVVLRVDEQRGLVDLLHLHPTKRMDNIPVATVRPSGRILPVI